MKVRGEILRRQIDRKEQMEPTVITDAEECVREVVRNMLIDVPMRRALLPEHLPSLGADLTHDEGRGSQ